jgi:hypothetical protein
MIRNLTLSLLAAAFAAPIASQNPCFNTDLGTSLGLGDDQTAQGLSLGFTFTYAGVAYTQICVCSNGYVWLGGTSDTGGDFSPTEAELRNGAPRICPLWSDFNPSATGSGQVYFDNATPGFAKVTWAGVYAFGATTPNDIQLVLDASNNITVVYGTTTAPASAGNVIIGASAGGGATTTAVSFAARPFLVASDSFAEELAVLGNAPVAYGNTRMQWTSANPGYAVTEVACVPNQLPHPARAVTFGTGCPSGAPSLYELFNALNPADLSGRTLSFTPTGAQTYVASPDVSPTWFSGFSNNLLLGDDQTTPINLPFAFPWNGVQINRIQVCSNGFLTLGNQNPGAPFNPSVPAMLAGPARISGFWEDLNPPAAGAGGGVFADLDPVTGDFVVTWNAVPEYQNNPPETFQIALSPTGRFTIRWLTVQVTNGTFLAGYSRGGGAPLTPPSDLSAVTSTTVNNVIQNPMTLSAASTSVPSLGTTFAMETGGIPVFPNGVVSVLFTSIEAVTPIPLDAAGLPGCTAYLQIPELFSTVQISLGAPTAFFYSIPNDPYLMGLELASQAITDDVQANAFGFRVSNGVRWTLGL